MMVESPRSFDQLADLRHMGARPSIAKQVERQADGDRPLLPSRSMLAVEVSVSSRGWKVLKQVEGETLQPTWGQQLYVRDDAARQKYQALISCGNCCLCV